ncbi:MAG: TlpA family protein disulfide reductase [Bryobacteraceae bacterium]|nr:TlpA family protein disulfide reductase [Bryobacteraceae bacterium]MDW8377584.1 TlpA disulfide reductase family protein [Bryobacterales bacterium]
MNLPASLIACLLFWSELNGADIAGVWHAAVRNPAGEEVAFQLDLRPNGAGWEGALVNGSDRNVSTAGVFDGRQLRLEFDYWDAVLEASLESNCWVGQFRRTYRKTTLVREFRAQREPLHRVSSKPQVDFSGEWLLEVTVNGKPEPYRAVLKQQGETIEGILLHITGDSGALTGYVEGRQAVLSRFDGIRATLVKLQLDPEAGLTGTLDSSKPFVGKRATSTVEEPTAITRMRDPDQPFRFEFPDLEGRIVRSSEERFQGKVLLITIMGSWCPNCHDEAPLLNELYQRFRSRGLEVVALGFEYTGQADRDVRQLKIFAKRHALAYLILYAGATEEAEKKLPQLENFRSYPTTILVGRDGRVRLIHNGFDGPATGERYWRLKQELTEAVERALAGEPGEP